MFQFLRLRSYISVSLISVILSSCSNTHISNNSYEELTSKNTAFAECMADFKKRKFLLNGGEYFPDYINPRTLNDKVMYILRNYYFKSPITNIIGNKYNAKKFIKDAVGSKHVVKLLGVYDTPQDINWNNLPNKFVLKSVRGHYGQQVILVNDKKSLNIPETIKTLESFCHLPYMKKYTKNRIIAEEYIEFEKGVSIDYKFFCSYGQPLFAYCLTTNTNKINSNMDVKTKTFSMYSVPNWKRLPVLDKASSPNLIAKPKKLKKMIEIASKLSLDLPLVRIDLYETNNRVLVGELTEDSCGAMLFLNPVTWDFLLGEKIKTPTIQDLNDKIAQDKLKYQSDLNI